MLFLGLSVVCDDFFVPSLEKISDSLHLSEDVAGATFMAAGSSAPELFASMMSLMNPSADDSIGIATIVGSAVFNVLVIIGATGALAGKDLVLDWKPLGRDAIFYGACVGLLLLFIIDGKVYAYEGGILTACYMGYIGYMGVNSKVFEKLDAMFPQWAPKEEPAGVPPEAELVEYGLLSPSAAKVQAAVTTTVLVNRFIRNARRSTLVRKQRMLEQGSPKVGGGMARALSSPSKEFKVETNPIFEAEEAATAASRAPGLSRRLSKKELSVDVNMPESAAAAAAAAVPGDGEGGEEEDEVPNPFAYPANESVLDKTLWLLALPFYAFYCVTIPDCRKASKEKWFVVSFVTSILWIGLLSWFMVGWASIIGCVLKIPPVAMGITVLAAGTSIPDALGSIAVAKQGQGDMAVSNAIGSNVFDILLGLGFPWLLAGLTRKEGFVQISKDDLALNIVILFGVLLIYVGVLLKNNLTLTKQIGFGLLVVYACFVVFTVIYTLVRNKSSC